jgi:cytochrome c556
MRANAPLRDRATASLTRLVAAACVIMLTNGALGQDGGAAPAKDTIFARKILMGSIDANMDEIETMLAPEGKLDLVEGRQHADIISIMLMAFPHMFPPGTNQWTAGADRDAALDTYAAPEVWTQFADFYQKASAASKIAFEASRAADAAAFKTRIAALRAACNGCHAVYQKTD